MYEELTSALSARDRRELLLFSDYSPFFAFLGRSGVGQPCLLSPKNVSFRRGLLSAESEVTLGLNCIMSWVATGYFTSVFRSIMYARTLRVALLARFKAVAGFTQGHSSGRLHFFPCMCPMSFAKRPSWGDMFPWSFLC